MKSTRAMFLAAAVAAGTFGMSQGVSMAQDAAKQPDRSAKQAERQARKAEKAEQEQFNNMPKPAREALTAQIGNGTGINYYKVADGETRTFGAVFKDAGGETIDVRVDRDGKLLARMSTADAAAAAAPQPAPGTPAPAPTPAPAAPASPTAPAPAAILPGQNVALEQIPGQPQAVLREQVKGAHDIRFYRAMFGNQEVWEAKFTSADGRDMAVRVDDTGKVVNSKALDDDEKANKERREVKFDSMPGAVKDQFRQVTRGHSGAQFYQNSWKGQQVYETMYWDNDQRWVVRLDASGKEIDRAVLKDAKKVSDYDNKKKDDDNKKDKDKDKDRDRK